ncbi:MAG: PH domain-containing protein [Planctomycetes bacterium]|nr:PH domain-containing protein [Planctomycetota bacterium]
MTEPTKEDLGHRIREIWPSVARAPGIASLGKLLNNTIILAPLGWLLMAGVYFGKVLPIIGVRYRLTDKCVAILSGWGVNVSEKVDLKDIDDVVLNKDSIDNFFRSADLEIIQGGKVLMTLTAVPDAEAFRHAILDARNAWAPDKVKTLPFIPASATK